MVVDVSFPALSEVIRDRPSGLKRTYYRFHLAIATAAYFCGGGLIASGESIISVLYDARYQQAGPVLEILGLALFAYPLRVATQAFLALGLARVYFQLHFIRIAALLLGVPIGFNLFGINGAVCGVVFSYFSSLPITAIQAARVGIFDLRREIVPFPAVALGWLCGEVFNLGIAYLLH
jgi:O-antigen/teichoic acid export membrane protein